MIAGFSGARFIVCILIPSGEFRAVCGPCFDLRMYMYFSTLLVIGVGIRLFYFYQYP